MKSLKLWRYHFRNDFCDQECHNFDFYNSITLFAPHFPVSCRVRTLELTATPTNLANQVKLGHALDQTCSVQHADLSEHTKTMTCHDDRRRQIVNFWSRFEMIKWLHLLCMCGIKTKPHFEWVLWHGSSLSVNWPHEDHRQKTHALGFLLYFFSIDTNKCFCIEEQRWKFH